MILTDVVTRGPCWLMNGLELFPVNKVICGLSPDISVSVMEDPSLGNCHQTSHVFDNTSFGAL